jgi:hypothetical protein
MILFRYFVIPKRLAEAYEAGELDDISSGRTGNSETAGDEDLGLDEQGHPSLVLDHIAHTEIEDPYAEEVFDSWLVCS